MTHTLHTKEGFIYAYTIFRTVDIDGKPKNEGLYIYIEDMWIHDSYHFGKTLKELIKYIDEHSECKNAKFVYWRMDKYDRIKMFLRDRLSKLGA